MLCPLDRGYQTPYTTQDQDFGEVWVELIWMGSLGGPGSLSISQQNIEQTLLCGPRLSAGSTVCILTDASQIERQCKRDEREKRKGSRQTEGSSLSFSGRDKEFHAVDYDGCFSIHAVDYTFSQSFCSHKFSAYCAGSSMGRSPSESIPRPRTDARRDQDPRGASGKDAWQERDQEPSSGYDPSWQSQGPLGRSVRTPQSSSSTLDEAYVCGNPDLGTTTGGISETSSLFDRAGNQGKIRNYCDKQNHPAAQPHCRWSGGPIDPSGSACRRGSTGRCSRQRGGEHADPAASSSQELRRIPWPRHRAAESGGNRGWRSCCGGRQTSQKTKIARALCWGAYIMNFGRALGVECNPWHEANRSFVSDVSTDAYWPSFAEADAACAGIDEYYQPFRIWTHSANHEPSFVGPLQAVSDALCLQWEVVKNLYNDFCGTPTCSNYPFPSFNTLSQRPHSQHDRNQHVRFADHIDVWIGAEEDLDMCKVRVRADAICNWNDKPWSRRRTKIKQANAVNTGIHVAPHLEAVERFHFKPSLPMPFLITQAPLSYVAVSSRVDDSTNFMQISQCKQVTHSEQD